MRRMLTLGQLFATLKSYFVNKTSTGTETMAGSIVAQNITANGSFFGNVDPSVSVIKKITSAQAATTSLDDVVQHYGGVIYVADSLSANNNCALFLVSYEPGDASYTVTMIKNQGSELPFITCQDGQGNDYLASYFNGISDQMPIRFVNATNTAAGLGGMPVVGIENSTLHIKGTFTPSQNIASGTKLFSTNQTLSVRMTHGSAINTGSTGSEAFIGISIQTNGDVYCLGALSSGVTYNIAVTATM